MAASTTPEVKADDLAWQKGFVFNRHEVHGVYRRTVSSIPALA